MILWINQVYHQYLGTNSIHKLSPSSKWAIHVIGRQWSSICELDTFFCVNSTILGSTLCTYLSTTWCANHCVGLSLLYCHPVHINYLCWNWWGHRWIRIYVLCEKFVRTVWQLAGQHREYTTGLCLGPELTNTGLQAGIYIHTASQDSQSDNWFEFLWFIWDSL